jgi:hypothetical protein
MRLIKESNPKILAIWVLLLIAGFVSLGFARWSLAFISFATLASSTCCALVFDPATAGLDLHHLVLFRPNLSGRSFRFL